MKRKKAYYSIAIICASIIIYYVTGSSSCSFGGSWSSICDLTFWAFLISIPAAIIFTILGLLIKE